MNSTPSPHCGMPFFVQISGLLSPWCQVASRRAGRRARRTRRWRCMVAGAISGCGRRAARLDGERGLRASAPRTAGRSSGCRGRSWCRCRNPTSGTTSAPGRRPSGTAAPAPGRATGPSRGRVGTLLRLLRAVGEADHLAVLEGRVVLASSPPPRSASPRPATPRRGPRGPAR